MTKRYEDDLSEAERAEIRKHLEPWRQKLLEIMGNVEKERKENEEADRKKKTPKRNKGLTGLTS